MFDRESTYVAAATMNIFHQQKNYPTQQQKNGFKQQLLREKSTKCLLDLFHKKFSTNPTTLYQELSQTKHKKELDELKKKGVLKNDQYDVIFPQSQQTDSTLFDITLLFLLIRTLCGHKTPSNGWYEEPDVNDVDDIANALRLKLERNRMQHGQLSITTVEYRRSFQYVKKPLLALGCSQNDLNDLLPSFEYNPPQANVNFTGRDDELKEINDSFNLKKACNVVITGIPGVGKSETANHYYVTHQTDYDHVIKINVDNIENDFKNVATILKLDEKTYIQVIIALLKTYFQNEMVLYIYDNCTAVEQLTKYLDPGHHNLITTQIQHWGAGYEIVTIDKWSEQSATKFLKNQLKTADPKELSELSKELEFHPLGLQHAVASITQTQLPINEYLDELRKHKVDMLSERVALGYGIRTSVFVSFFITIERIERESPEVMKLLSLFGILDGTFMLEEFLKRCYETKTEYNKSKRILFNYSIIQAKQQMTEFNNKKFNYLTVHSLYQEAVKIYITKNRALQKILEQFIEMFSSEKWVSFDTTSEYKLWLNHLQHLWEQDCYKDIIVSQLSNYPAVEIFSPSECFLKDIARRIYDSTKNDLKNPVSYYLDCCYAGQELAYWENFEQRVNENLEESPVKRNLLERITNTKAVLNTDNSENVMRKFIVFYLNGHFEQMPSFLQILPAQTIEMNFFRSICYKETQEFDKALDLLYTISDYKHEESSAKVQIGCCMILNGEIQKGMKVIEESEPLSNDSICDAGRACFDVGLFDESNKYFKSWLASSPIPCTAIAVDAFCKILMLPDDLPVDVLYSVIITMRARDLAICFKIRGLILLYCLYVKNDEVSMAEQVAMNFSYAEIEEKRYTSNIFREAFILADHWLKTCRFYKALVVYRMIDELGDEIDDHEQICVELDWDLLDVDEQIDFCIAMLRKIFHL
uniref:DZIP3-like HEPN domain-containing protein n=1 Tax=Clytia hemisphaerica TaxID=252671 RepID=A0A7M5V425_9CNID